MCTLQLQFFSSSNALSAFTLTFLFDLFLFQGIFPACYIHLKEATVEGSGSVLLIQIPVQISEYFFIILYLSEATNSAKDSTRDQTGSR